MDGIDTYYIAQLLDSWFKFQLLQQELSDNAKDIICHTQDILYNNILQYWNQSFPLNQDHF